jgi:hypothetical protein
LKPPQEWNSEPKHPTRSRVHSGKAFARLGANYQGADKMRTESSPGFVLNEGHQKLYGNSGSA